MHKNTNLENFFIKKVNGLNIFIIYLTQLSFIELNFTVQFYFKLEIRVN